ncbi:phosphopantetheine-binding protein [Amycolatopsis alba]|nr:phosphopantetheine-binding protein [Amycolatopsis alba]
MSKISHEQMTADIAEAMGVGVDEIRADVNLRDAGLDSIRLMSLVEKWRAEGIEGADFVTLATEPTVGAWATAITGEDAQSGVETVH